MKVLGLRSVIKIGSSKYTVKSIEKKGLALIDSKGRSTLYDLASIEENLANSIMKVES